MDWPNCPTTTRLSLMPCRNGPKISCQGAGSTSSVSRKALGISGHDSPPQLVGMMLRTLVAGHCCCAAGWVNRHLFWVNRHLLRLHRVMKLEQVARPEMSLMGLACPLREQNGSLDCFCNGAKKSEGPWV